MLDATKVKPQRVAVVDLLRPEGVLLLTKYCAKIQSPNRREFTQAVNDRVGIVYLCSRSLNYPYGTVNFLSLPLLDHL